MRTRARVNWGRWIADCADRWCSSAEKLRPGQTAIVCTNCKQISKVEWPSNPGSIDAALRLRPVPDTRNWFPGETVEDLIRENTEHGLEGGG